MHARALEIAWHDSTSIWSIDISPTNRLLTAGGDKVARVWRLSNTPYDTLHRINDSSITKAAAVQSQASLVDWLCDLRAHTTTVNVAKFSRDGFTIATGADGGEIVLWALEDGEPVKSLGDVDAPLPKERWIRLATLRGHVQDVLDLAWSSDGSRLVSASIDNAIKVWDVRNSSKTPFTLRSHNNFVQGVSIDPFSRLIASLGNDRALRIFTSSTSNSWYQVASVSSHMDINDTRLFVDDTKFKNCFRRLAWSPDGSVVVCPSGIHFPPTKRLFAVHIFARNTWHRPAAQCGGLTKPACAARFSPVLYELRGVKEKRDGVDVAPGNTGKGPFASFKYRMVFAVLCVDSVLFYETEALSRPFAMVEGLHCAENTDISWSPDGLTAAISSVDGYVSFVCFTKEELGQPLAPENTPQWLNCREELEQARTARSPRKSKVAVTVVRPKQTNDSGLGSNRPSLQLPPPPVAVADLGKEASNLPLPGPSPIAPDGSAKATMSLSANDPQLANVTKTANGGQRVSVTIPANNQSLSTPSQSGETDMGSENAETAMREAMSDMLMIEHSQSPKANSTPRDERGESTTKQDVLVAREKANPDKGALSSVTELPATKLDGGDKLAPVTPAKNRTESASKQETSTITISSSPGKAVSVDPASPLKSSTTVVPNASKPVPPTPSLAKRLAHVFGALDAADAELKINAPKGRPKSSKVQTTLHCFTSASRKPPEKPVQRQNVPENRKVSSDSLLQKRASAIPKRKLALQKPQDEEEDDIEIVEVQEVMTEKDTMSGEAKRRKLAEYGEAKPPC